MPVGCNNKVHQKHKFIKKKRILRGKLSRVVVTSTVKNPYIKNM